MRGLDEGNSYVVTRNGDPVGLLTPFDGTVLFELRFWLRRLRTHLVSTRSDFEKTLTDRFPKT